MNNLNNKISAITANIQLYKREDYKNTKKHVNKKITILNAAFVNKPLSNNTKYKKIMTRYLIDLAI